MGSGYVYFIGGGGYNRGVRGVHRCGGRGRGGVYRGGGGVHRGGGGVYRGG